MHLPVHRALSEGRCAEPEAFGLNRGQAPAPTASATPPCAPHEKEVTTEIPCPTYNITCVSRGAGQSVMANAAYCAGESMYSEYEGIWKHPHSDPSRVVLHEVLLPPNAPPAYADPQTLWNAVDAAEESSTAQTARKIVLALPRELTFEQNAELIRAYCRKEFTEKGMVVDLYYHDSQDGNPHCHLLMTTRAMDENGKWLPKAKTVYALDENGERIRNANGRFKRITTTTVDWNDHKYAEIWRHDWEIMQNEALEKAGKEERIDMRSLKRQGITDREPQMHMGPPAAAMERKGIVTAVGEQNRTITESNKVLRGLKRILTSLKSWFQELSDTVRDMKIIDEPKTHNLIDVLNAYRNIRSRERADWNHYAREKGDLKDLKEYTSAFAYMVDNKIRTLEDLGHHLNEVGLRLNELNNRIKRNNRRIRDIADLLKAVDTVKELTPIEEELKSKRFGRQKFIDEHGSELDRLIKARHLIDKLTQGQKIDRKALLAESERLQREIDELQPDIHWTQIDMDHLKEIRSMVRKVIPDALPQRPNGQPPSMTEQLEEGRNKAELEQIKRRAAEHVLQANPTKQEIGMEEEQKQEQHQNERNG